MDPETRLTAPEAAMTSLGITADVVRQWKARSLIEAVGKRGRSPLFRWGDLLAVERDTRRSGYSHRRIAA